VAPIIPSFHNFLLVFAKRWSNVEHIADWHGFFGRLLPGNSSSVLPIAIVIARYRRVFSGKTMVNCHFQRVPVASEKFARLASVSFLLAKKKSKFVIYEAVARGFGNICERVGK
jgi:hypothetical protein